MTTGRSSILYQNAQQSAFLIDIPASIETAQFPHFSPVQAQHENGYSKLPTSNPCYRRIFSSTPLEQPYPSPPEPKSEAARARLLSRIPESEIRFHESISPFIRSGTENIQRAIPNGSKWCGSRRARSDVTEIRKVHEQNPTSEPDPSLSPESASKPPPAQKEPTPPAAFPQAPFRPLKVSLKDPRVELV